MKALCCGVLLLASTVLFSGCATTQLNSDVTPGVKLAELKKIYVVKQPDDDRNLAKLIADRLTVMGHQATSGDKSGIPPDADAFVTYQDRWMWDITMYMIELNVQVRKPQSEISLASGHSFRTSLARKSPPEMIDEVLTDIFKKG
jgi:hypothetical protein